MGKRKGTNDKYEKFCSLIVEGKDAAEAYREVYPHSRKWKPESVANKGYALLQRGDIQAILARMREDVQQRADVRKEDAVRSLKPILDVTMADFFNSEGRLKPMSEWSSTMKLCVQEMIYSRETGAIVGVKLYDRVKATERLAKMLGWDKPTEVDVKKQTDVGDLTIDEIREEIARLEKSEKLEKEYGRDE